MKIRKAQPFEAHTLAQLMNLAMSEIVFQFIGRDDIEESNRFMAYFIARKNNQYAYDHIFVAEKDQQILAQICLYPGKDLVKLRKPILDFAKKEFDTDYEPDHETQDGEIYIDTLAVSPQAQGKGIGRALLDFVIDLYVHQYGQILGLLVEKTNPHAKRLYEKVGFEVKGEVTIFGKTMDHMQVGT